MKKFYAILLMSVLVTSCAIMQGSVSVSTSPYDGVKFVEASPGWVNDDFMGTLLIGFRKNSDMKKDDVVMIVRNNEIKYFCGNGANFFIKIDGREYAFTPLSDRTECAVSTQYDVAHCTQQYFISIPFLEKMNESKDVRFKLVLANNVMVLGSLSKSGPTTARSAILKFLETVKKEFP